MWFTHLFAYAQKTFVNLVGVYIIFRWFGWLYRKYKPKEAICEDSLRHIPFKQRSDSAAAPKTALLNKHSLTSAIRR